MNKFLIVGLGNPGEKYKETKHNMGFIVLDNFSKLNNYEFNANIFDGLFYKYKNEENEIFVLKPQTYMNLSGECVWNFINFYKINFENILIIYDDLDIKLGKIKLKKFGSSGGQNGMKSIIKKLGTDKIKRLKVGIGRPNTKNIPIVDYVLSKLNDEEKDVLEKVLNNSSKIISKFSQVKFDQLMTEYNND